MWCVVAACVAPSFTTCAICAAKRRASASATRAASARQPLRRRSLLSALPPSRFSRWLKPRRRRNSFASVFLKIWFYQAGARFAKLSLCSFHFFNERLVRRDDHFITRLVVRGRALRVDRRVLLACGA